MADNRVYFPQATETECYGGRGGVVCPPKRLEDGESEECADKQIGEVIDELVARAATGTGKSELPVLFQGLADTPPKIAED